MSERIITDIDDEFFQLVVATGGANAPEVLAKLREVASDDEIAEFESQLRRREYLRRVITHRAIDQFVTYRKVS